MLCRGERYWIATVSWEKTERAVGPVFVVVAVVDAQHVLKVAAAEDEDPVDAVGANRATRRK